MIALLFEDSLPGKAIAPYVSWTWVFSKQPLPWAKCRIASPTILGGEVKWVHEHTAPTEGMQVVAYTEKSKQLRS